MGMPLKSGYFVFQLELKRSKELVLQYHTMVTKGVEREERGLIKRNGLNNYEK